jgi:hypothetical protein
MGYPPRKVIDLVSARVPTQREYEALELPSDLPILRTFRVVLSDKDRPIEATVMTKPGHLYDSSTRSHDAQRPGGDSVPEVRTSSRTVHNARPPAAGDRRT